MYLRVFLFFLFVPCIDAVAGQPAPTVKKVEVVFCLDLSASTNGLVDRVRDHLWDFATTFMDCKPMPSFRIGIVGFSRPSFSRETGYVKVLNDLTTDMEAVGKTLFDLRTTVEKGDQFVGHALMACAKNISWSQDTAAMKVVILAGNGEVHTGGLNPHESVKELQSLGVILHVLYCMPRTYGRREISGWEELATLGKGTFATFSVSTQYFQALSGLDMPRLRILNDSLNDTYLYYGPMGKTRWEMMRELDWKLFQSNPGGFLQRSRFKCSTLFQGRNSGWDLVDRVQSREVTDLASLDASLLPESLQAFSASERQQRIARARLDRHRILNEIQIMIRQWHAATYPEGEPEKMMPSFDILSQKILMDLLEKNGYVCRPPGK